MRNFRERFYGSNKIKAVKNKNNKILLAWVKMVPFLMVERKPIKQIALHMNSLMNVTDEAEPIFKVVHKKHTFAILEKKSNVLTVIINPRLVWNVVLPTKLNTYKIIKWHCIQNLQ